MELEINNVRYIKSTTESGDLYYEKEWYVRKEDYKVGDWVTVTSWHHADIELPQTCKITKITEKDNTPYQILLNKDHYGEKHNWWFREYQFKKATDSEIAEQLNKEAVELGLVPGAKFKRPSVDKNSICNITSSHGVYHQDGDKFVKNGYIVYENGKWIAEVIKPLFTTEDGVDIYEDEKCVAINKRDLTPAGSNWTPVNYDGSGSLYYIYFSTKEKALEYINKNEPKEYEILEFRNKSSSTTFIKKEDNIYYTPLEFSYSEKHLLEIQTISISKVKRTSDGEIFSIGDKCSSDFLGTFTIGKIKLVNDSYITFVNDNNTLECNMYYVKKIPLLSFGGYPCTFKKVLQNIYNHCLELLK